MEANFKVLFVSLHWYISIVGIKETTLSMLFPGKCTCFLTEIIFKIIVRRYFALDVVIYYLILVFAVDESLD